MGKLPIWEVSTEYQTKISQFCHGDGLDPTYVFPIVFSQNRLEQAIPRAKQLRSTPIFSIGFNVWNYPIGLICFEENFEPLFNEAEKEFILAHEYSHIIKKS